MKEMQFMRYIAGILLALALSACQSAYYEAAEQVGYHKRDILVDRVEASRDAQLEAEEQFQSALEQLSALTNFDGGDLEDIYEEMADEYEDSVAAAEEVSDMGTFDFMDAAANLKSVTGMFGGTDEPER